MVARVSGFVVSFCLFAMFSFSVVASGHWQDRVVPVSSSAQNVTLFSIVGSNTVGATLAPALVQAFLEANGFVDVAITPIKGENLQHIEGTWQGEETQFNARVTVEAKGSSTGFKALSVSSADLAASSRPIKSKEVVALSGLGNMESIDNEHIVAIDGLAIIVSPANPITKLSLKTIQDIFAGKITDWSKVGGPSGKINVLARDDKSGTYDTFKRLVLGKAKISSRATRYESNDHLSATVQKDKNAIGFVALPSVRSAKALNVSDGVAKPLSPSVLTVATEDYPLSRRLYFYSAEAGKRKEVVSEFVRFVQSDAGQSVVNQSGYVAQSLFSVPMDNSDDPRLADWNRMNLNIRFQDNTSSLDNKSLNDVKRLADFLAQESNKGRKITLVGFSNPFQDVSQSALSRLRAQNVRWALRDYGVTNKVITLAGNPVSVADPNSPNAERNRRVEVWIK